MNKRVQRIGKGRRIVIGKDLLDHLEIGEDDFIEMVPSAGGVLLRKSETQQPAAKGPGERVRPRGEPLFASDPRIPFSHGIESPRPSDAKGGGVVPVSKVRAWVDGGSRGNPGPAGYGAHLEDEKGHLIAEKSGYIGIATNNVAEYQGLLAALRGALELGARDVEVFADSELMVRQMNGRYQVKNEGLKRLFAQAKILAERIPRLVIKHVPRAQNRKADKLANEAMDRGE